MVSRVAFLVVPALLLASPAWAEPCGVKIGSWMLKKGDVVKVERSDDGVTAQLSAKGTRRLEDITQVRIGKTLPILFNGETLSEPVVRSAIYSGTFVIDGEPKKNKFVKAALSKSWHANTLTSWGAITRKPASA